MLANNQVLVVSYDLVAPGQKYERLINLIKGYGTWARLGGSAYLIATSDSPVSVRNHLMRALDQNDKLYIGPSPSPSAWFGMPEDVTNWILQNQA